MRANGDKRPLPAEVQQFQRFCSELRIDGKPFSTYPEELEIVAPYFDGVEETVVILPKKNGKSTLIAALIIYHVLTTPDAEAIVVAASREQAGIILRQSRKFIRNTPALQSHLRVLQREIHLIDEEGRARILASDEDTADGVLPTLAIVDELHRHRTNELYAVLRLAVGTTGGRMITISTAGASMATPLGEKRRRAYELPGFHRDPKLRRSYVRSKDGSFAFIEWCLNPNDDPNDLRLVKLVNPAPWKTLAMLAKEQAAVTPWQWLRFGCGIWTEGEEPWIEPAKWDALADRKLSLESADSVWIAVDLGLRAETAAIAIIQAGEKVHVKVELFEGTNLAKVEDAVRRLATVYNVKAIVYGSKVFQRSGEMLEGEGFSVIEYPQSPERMIAASATLYKLVEEGKLAHDGNAELRAQVLAGRVKESERGWRFVKDPNIPRPIDALIALAIGTHMATEMPDSPMALVEWV